MALALFLAVLVVMTALVSAVCVVIASAARGSVVGAAQSVDDIVGMFGLKPDSAVESVPVVGIDVASARDVSAWG